MEQRNLSPRTRVERRAEPPTYRQQVTRAVDPATYDLIGTVPQTPEAQVPAYVERAFRAAGDWRVATWEARNEA